MKQLRFLFPIYLLLIMLISSCEDAFTTVKEIDLPEHKQKLAVFSNLNDSYCEIFISHSKAFDDTSEYKKVKANVNILKNHEDFFSFVYPDDLKHGNIINRYIQLPNNIKEGEKYSLEIISDEFGTATASLKVPNKPVINDILYIEDYYFEQYDTLDKLEFSIEDSGGADNYYLFNVNLTYYELTEKRIRIYASTDEPLVKEVYGYFDHGFIISNKTFNGQNKKIILKIQKYTNFYPYQPGDKSLDTVYLNISAITKDYYNFLLSKNQYEQSSENPFAEPVNVYNNIENGYGMFFAKKSETKTIKIK